VLLAQGSDADVYAIGGELLRAFLWSLVAPQGPVVTKEALQSAAEFRGRDANVQDDERSHLMDAVAIVREVLARG
jgi:hypothetical protein